MANKKMVMSCVLCAVILAAAVEAAAKDFTITVPVRLYNMVQGVGKAKVQHARKYAPTLSSKVKPAPERNFVC